MTIKKGDFITVIEITNGEVHYIESDGTLRLNYNKLNSDSAGFSWRLTDRKLLIYKKEYIETENSFLEKKISIHDRIRFFLNPNKYFEDIIKELP